MRWTPSPDRLSLKSGDYTICKCGTGNETKYVLWHGTVLIDVFDSADLAKQEAEKGITCGKA